MVLVHGFGCGGAIFYRTLEDLSKFFHIYLIDLLGMGASGRPEYTCTDVEGAEEWFIRSIKCWKDKIGLE